MRLLSATLALALMAVPAQAQHNHAAGHGFYKGWINQNGQGCCNDQDCGALNDADERTVAGKLEVRIEGQWCPVLPRHYLTKGNAPDWQTAHVCVQPDYADDMTGEIFRTDPCGRLLCYQPKPQF